MVKVKICGITNIDDALAASDLGADMIGFNFYEKSPRCIVAEKAREIGVKIKQRYPVKTFGVFVNEDLDEAVRIALYANIDVIQLHGDESPFYCEQAEIFSGLSIVKAFRKNAEVTLDLINGYESTHENDIFDLKGVLVDAYSPSAYGGIGELTDWNFARSLVENSLRLYLAGGLTPENVADAVRSVRPYAVDVASGVESAPGIKDHEMMKAFITNAKNA